VHRGRPQGDRGGGRKARWLGTDVMIFKYFRKKIGEKVVSWLKTKLNYSKILFKKWENKSKKATKYTNWLQNIPNDHNIYQMTTKYTKNNKIYKVTTKYAKWLQTIQNDHKL
jgi:hypothetical protein